MGINKNQIVWSNNKGKPFSDGYFKVSGGHLASEQIMGVWLGKEDGSTLGVCCSTAFGKQVQALSFLLNNTNLIDRIEEQRSDGFLCMNNGDDIDSDLFYSLMEDLKSKEAPDA